MDRLGLNQSPRVLPPYTQRTCSQCIHFFPIENHSLEIQRDKFGQCRESPPAAHMINAQQNVALYPMIPEHWQACSHFESALSFRQPEDEDNLDAA